MQESDYEFGVAHDHWLSAYHRDTREVWCSNPACTLHFDGAEIDAETENGQTSFIPEDCYLCHSEWLEDRPEEEEDET